MTGGLPFDLGFYHYTLPRTFYRFYHAVEQQNGKFLCFTVSCNKSALGFRLRRTSPRRSSFCASHFIESVGNECKRGTSGIQSSSTLWSEKNELSQPMGLTSFFFCLDHTTIHPFCQVFLFELPHFFCKPDGKREGRLGGPPSSRSLSPEKELENHAVEHGGADAVGQHRPGDHKHLGAHAHD